MNVGVVGLWHLGETVAVLLAALGHNVIGIDIDKKVIQKLNSGVPPIEEPGLRELLAKHLKKGENFDVPMGEWGFYLTLY